MATDPRRLRPSELCRLLNSTPLGEVITLRQLRQHRIQASQHIGTSQHVDLLRYTAWLIRLRHAPKPTPPAASAGIDLAEAALGAARLACREEHVQGHGHKFTRKHEAVIAALLTEPTHAQAVTAAGISERTLYRWLQRPEFVAALRRARLLVIEAPLGRLHAAVGLAVDALVNVVRHAKRDADRTRASISVLDFVVTKAQGMHELPKPVETTPLGTADVVKGLSARLRQIEESHLPMAEKARLTTAVSDALLRAIQVDVLEQRLAAVENVLLNRPEKG